MNDLKELLKGMALFVGAYLLTVLVFWLLTEIY